MRQLCTVFATSGFPRFLDKSWMECTELEGGEEGAEKLLVSQ